MNAPARIDFDTVRRTADLRALIVADIGEPSRSRKWCCPFHPDSNPSLTLTPDGRRWRCWSCNAAGDALDWLVRRDGIDIVEAARRLGGPEPFAGASRTGVTTRSTARRYDSPSGAGKPSPAWQDPAWQAAVEKIVCRAEESLWSRGGRPALDWLRARGLADHTIGRFRLGYVVEDVRSEPLDCLADRGGPRPIKAPRGILIPWVAPGAWYSRHGSESPERRWVGANVRRLAPDPREPLPRGVSKCQALAGSTRGHLYPEPEILPAQGELPALIVEGEFDALIGWQEAGWLVHVGTVGGAHQEPQRSALVALSRCPWWLLAFDHDTEGVKAAWTWKDRAPHKTRRIMLPAGKDLTEFVQSGGNVPGWLASECERCGLMEAS